MRRFTFFLVLIIAFSDCSHYRSKILGTAENKFCIPDSLTNQVRFDTVRIKPVYNELKLLGKVTYDQEKVVRIYPLVSGIVTDVNVSLGSYVKKDQVLAVIKSSEMASAENDLVSARSNFSVAEKNLAAAADMYKSGLLSEKDYSASIGEMEKAKSELNRASTVLAIYGTGQQADYTVRAPISGFIVEKFINANMQIRQDNNANLFTISDLKKVWVLANVYESDISSIKENEKVEVTTISYPGKIFEGKIDKIYNFLDPDNKTMKVQIQLDNSEYLLKPEMFAVATVYQSTDEKMVAVPAGSVVFDRNQYWVVVYRDRCDVEVRNVAVVSSNSTDTYIRSGVKPGDVVIVNRQLLLYDALTQ